VCERIIVLEIEGVVDGISGRIVVETADMVVDASFELTLGIFDGYWLMFVFGICKGWAIKGRDDGISVGIVVRVEAGLLEIILE